MIPHLEISEYYDWIDAAKLLQDEDEIWLMNIAAFGNPVNKETSKLRTRWFNNLKNKFLMSIGVNPFKVDPRKIERYQRMVQRRRKAWKKRQSEKKHGNSKSDSS